MNAALQQTIDLYKSGKTAREIAKILDVTDRCIWKRLNKVGLGVRKMKKEELRRNVTLAHEEVDAGADLQETLVKYGISEASYNNMFKVIRREQNGHQPKGDEKLEAEIQPWQMVPDEIPIYPKMIVQGHRYEDVTSWFGR